MNSVNKTLYIPLYGKSYVSKKGVILNDKKAEEIWEKEEFLLKGKSKSKWLAYYMGIRSAVFDEWLTKQMIVTPDAVVIHVGCGMDSRILRVGNEKSKWYDVDFSEVIDERKKYYLESSKYQMIEGDVRDSKWLSKIKENGDAIVIMEGVSMYLSIDEMQKLINSLCIHFENIKLLVDCYTPLAVKLSKRRNPINEVGVNQVYGIDNPLIYQTKEFTYVKEHTMIPQKYIDELKGFERFIFSKVYAGGFSKKLYRLYEYKKINFKK